MADPGPRSAGPARLVSGDGACDTHIHFYDERYPAAPAAILRPPDVDVFDYRHLQAELGLDRTVVVQPTTYGLDNRCQMEAVAELGEAARAVVVVDDTVDDSELAELTALGARGARFHMLPGGAVQWSMLPEVARRIEPHGWHVQLQLDGNELETRQAELSALPVPLVVDHVGRFMPPPDVSDGSFRALLELVEGGRCWVKLSAPYESSTVGPPEYPDVTRLVNELVEAAPERMLWASNWPHPGRLDPPTPADLAALLHRWVPDVRTRRRILVDNPAQLYGFDR